MSDPSRANPGREPQWLSIPPARPRATAYILGIMLIIIVAGSLSVAFLVPPSGLTYEAGNIHVNASTALAATGAAVSLIGLLFLISGNIRRIRLIYEFTARAIELEATIADDDDDDAEERPRSSSPGYRAIVIQELGDYEKALLKLGAYEQALVIAGWIAQNGGRMSNRLRHYLSRQRPRRTNFLFDDNDEL